MGEIGIPRREFLYDLKLWEIVLITRGYFRRFHPGWEQARLVAYNAAHAMGSKHMPPPINTWLPFPWEKEQAQSDLPSDEEIEEIREMLKKENEKN